MTEIYRIIATGSRHHTDRALVRHALTERMQVHCLHPLGFPVCGPEQILVIHGAQGYTRKDGVTIGADLLFDQEAKALGMRTDPHPANWRGPCRPECHHGPRKINWGQDYCQMAGMYRNTEMVELQPLADLCIALPLDRSTGTPDCMRKARAAGIEVVEYVAAGVRS
jgi:hypothetical protein